MSRDAAILITVQQVLPTVATACICFVRYGNELAYAPHSINPAGPTVVNYTSDGSTPVDFRLWATDIAGQNVTAGKPVTTCCVFKTSCTPKVCVLCPD